MLLVSMKHFHGKSAFLSHGCKVRGLSLVSISHVAMERLIIAIQIQVLLLPYQVKNLASLIFLQNFQPINPLLIMLISTYSVFTFFFPKFYLKILISLFQSAQDTCHLQVKKDNQNSRRFFFAHPKREKSLLLISAVKTK